MLVAATARTLLFPCSVLETNKAPRKRKKTAVSRQEKLIVKLEPRNFFVKRDPRPKTPREPRAPVHVA